MKFRVSIAFCAVFLGACNPFKSDPNDPALQLRKGEPAPAIYRVDSSPKKTEAYLFGTIHKLPKGVKWRTAQLQSIIKKAPILVVEANDLGDAIAVYQEFSKRAALAKPVALSARIAPEKRALLNRAITKSGLKASDLATMKTWAAALLLSNIEGGDDPDNGTDKALLEQYGEDNSIQLEGAAHQFATLDALPEASQRVFLTTMIEGVLKGPNYSQLLTKAWRHGDLDTIYNDSVSTVTKDPVLYEQLLKARNTKWADRIAALSKTKPPLFIAVGAAHLPGKDGLITLLENKGYSVTRVQ